MTSQSTGDAPFSEPRAETVGRWDRKTTTSQPGSGSLRQPSSPPSLVKYNCFSKIWILDARGWGPEPLRATVTSLIPFIPFPIEQETQIQWSRTCVGHSQPERLDTELHCAMPSCSGQLLSNILNKGWEELPLTNLLVNLLSWSKGNMRLWKEEGNQPPNGYPSLWFLPLKITPLARVIFLKLKSTYVILLVKSLNDSPLTSG